MGEIWTRTTVETALTTRAAFYDVLPVFSLLTDRTVASHGQSVIEVSDASNTAT